MLFRRLYELRAKEAAEGGAKVVVVGPPCAGKTTFVKQFLEPKLKEKFGDLSRVEEVTAGLAPGKKKAQVNLRKVIKRIFARRYVSGHKAAEELKDIKGADHLKAFDKLPRDFVEYLKERYREYSLYLFYVSPDAGEDRDVVERLWKVAERVGVEFKWLGLEYVPPGVAAILKERGEDYVEEQLRLYRRILEEFDAAGGRLVKLARLGRSVAERTGESLLERFAEAIEEFAKVLLPLLPGGVAAGAVMGVASYLLAGGGEWSRWIRLLVDWSRLDGRLKDLAAAHIAFSLGLDRDRVREVLDGLAAAGERLKALESDFSRLLDEVKRLALEVAALKYGVAVYFLHDVESRGLYVNFYVEDRPYLESREPSGLVAVPLVEGGRFGELAAEALRRLEEEGAVVLVGPKGVGKSTLAAYVVWRALREGRAYGVVKVAGGVGTEAVLRALADVAGAELIALYDPSPPEVYYDPDYVKLTKVQQVGETLKELGALAAGEKRVKILAVLPSDLYNAALKKAEEPVSKLLKKRLEVDLRDVKFLADVIYKYSKCEEMQAGEAERLAEKIAEFNGGYTLVAKYAGLWLREHGCDVSDVEKAVEEVKQKPKLFLARYIRDVLLWRSSEDERVRLMYRAAAPLLLHAVFGPVPEGVTYITQAKDGVVFYQPEEIEKFTQPQWDLLKAGLQPIAKWLAQWHEDLVEETLRDLAGLNGEEARKQYEEALGDLIKALNWARDEVLKEGVPKERRRLLVALLVFVARRLAAVFKSSKVKSCWRRIAFIAGHVLAGYFVLSTTKPPEDDAETLGDVLKPCAVDAYLTTDDVIPPLSIFIVELPYYVKALSQIVRIRKKLGVLTSYVDADIIRDARKTAEELMKRWRRRGINLHEVFYALGLAALVAEGEVDEKTADLLVHAASAAVQRVAHSASVLPILAALRPLGEKAPHRYIHLLAAASEPKIPSRETVEYIYDALQQLKDRLTETGRLWLLVEAIRAYSNLLIKHSTYIKDRWEEAVADMCELYSKVKGCDDTTAPESGLSAQRLFDTIAKVYVLAAALRGGRLAPLVQRYCGLGDLVKEAEAMRSALEEAAAHPEELRKIKNEDFANWVTARNVTGDVGEVVEDLKGWFTYVLARYKLSHAIDEKGELDAEKLEETAEEFEKAAEISSKLKHWDSYLIAHGWALRARVLAAKSWKDLLKRAEGFQKLWEEAGKHPTLTAEYLKAATLTLSDYLVYLAASGDRERAEELLKEWRWLLDYDGEVSVNTRLMLRLLGVGEGAKLEEVVKVFKRRLSRRRRPALLMLTDRLQRDEALEECVKLREDESVKVSSKVRKECVESVAAAAGDQKAVERLKLEIERKAPEAHPLLEVADGKTLVEVLTPISPAAQLAFTLLAAVEGRVDAVRLHGLWVSARSKRPLAQQLFRAVYENCNNLNSVECKMALLKLYYLHY